MKADTIVFKLRVQLSNTPHFKLSRVARLRVNASTSPNSHKLSSFIKTKCHYRILRPLSKQSVTTEYSATVGNLKIKIKDLTRTTRWRVATLFGNSIRYGIKVKNLTRSTCSIIVVFFGCGVFGSYSLEETLSNWIFCFFFVGTRCAKSCGAWDSWITSSKPENSVSTLTKSVAVFALHLNNYVLPCYHFRQFGFYFFTKRFVLILLLL